MPEDLKECKHENRYIEKEKHGYTRMVIDSENWLWQDWHEETVSLPDTITTYCADCGLKLKEVEVHGRP